MRNGIYQINREEFGSKGDEIYEKIKPLLEPEHKGEIVAIEVESGDHFLAETVIEAWQKAKKKYPDKVFYFVRIGYPVVHVFR
ncbi:MAG: hypothetical protein FJ014_08640 [Chloroflexi bacterium]|nr:hypothetical protein [Chloroflexota bacterium]